MRCCLWLASPSSSVSPAHTHSYIHRMWSLCATCSIKWKHSTTEIGFHIELNLFQFEILQKLLALYCWWGGTLTTDSYSIRYNELANTIHHWTTVIVDNKLKSPSQPQPLCLAFESEFFVHRYKQHFVVSSFSLDKWHNRLRMPLKYFTKKLNLFALVN